MKKAVLPLSFRAGSAGVGPRNVRCDWYMYFCKFESRPRQLAHGPPPPRATGHMAASPREDPSRLTKEELSTRGAETVAAVGAIARLVAKQSVSAPLQSTISTFADYEKTVVSTEEMLRKTMKGMSDMSDALDEISSSMQG